MHSNAKGERVVSDKGSNTEENRSRATRGAVTETEKERKEKVSNDCSKNEVKGENWINARLD